MKKKELKNTKTYLVSVMAVMLLFWITGCGDMITKSEVPEEQVAYEEVGQEISTWKIAEADGSKQTVSYKITQIHRDPEYVEKAIEEYNFSGVGNPIGALKNDNLQYCIADYQVIYPEGFPTGEYGVTNTPITFKVVGLDGKETIKADGINYKSLNDTIEIGDVPMGFDFFPPETYQGSFVFLMVKEYDEYLFTEVYPEGVEGEPRYVRGQ